MTLLLYASHPASLIIPNANLFLTVWIKTYGLKTYIECQFINYSFSKFFDEKKCSGKTNPIRSVSVVFRNDLTHWCLPPFSHQNLHSSIIELIVSPLS